MFLRILIFLALANFTFADDHAAESSDSGTGSSPSTVLPSDFFAGALADATAISDEAGKQRLIDVKSTTLSPALAFGSSFKYINNPEKILCLPVKEMVPLWM